MKKIKIDIKELKNNINGNVTDQMVLYKRIKSHKFNVAIQIDGQVRNYFTFKPNRNEAGTIVSISIVHITKDGGKTFLTTGKMEKLFNYMICNAI
jgi:hypothetical protein